MVRSRRWYLARRRTSLMAVPNEEFPLTGRILKLVQIKSNQIIKEVAFDLSSKYVELRAQYV